MEANTGWLSLDETAALFGVWVRPRLYTLAREGRIPARKIGKKWVFEKAGLDAWVRTKQPLESFFLNLDFDIEGNAFLREPQHDGYLRTYEFFHAGKDKAILQIPSAGGKTGLAALLPLGLAEGRVIVIAPNLTIKNGLLRRDGHNEPPEMLLA